jgi:hypothetical protein
MALAKSKIRTVRWISSMERDTPEIIFAASQESRPKLVRQMDEIAPMFVIRRSPLRLDGGVKTIQDAEL